MRCYKMNENLNIALPKGRLSQSAFELMALAGYAVPSLENSRSLVVEDSVNQFTYFFVKPTDVPTYVERGVCDIGITGKDVIIESDKDIYELIDLKIGQCKMVLAGINDDVLNKQGGVVIATKFPKIAIRYFNSINQSPVIIKLNGSVELGPIVKLSDAIVDIYETGSTLKANGLKVFDDIQEISAYLISNKASYRLKHRQIINLLQRLKEVV